MKKKEELWLQIQCNYKEIMCSFCWRGFYNYFVSKLFKRALSDFWQTYICIFIIMEKFMSLSLCNTCIS